ncbi:50S ribosomal protein L10e [uncultured archaeon]|nr:50S ribosomal protein L10e [uncultured archaeon]
MRDTNKPSWTRYSRSKPRKSYIKAMPHQDITQFRMGAMKPDYNVTFRLISKQNIQIRDNALESARQALNKYLEKAMLGNFYFVIRVFPHQVIRENKMIAGAGADRLQKGMRQSFGRATDKAARVRKSQEVLTITTYKDKISTINVAIDRALKKLPGDYSVVMEEKKAAA